MKGTEDEITGMVTALWLNDFRLTLKNSFATCLLFISSADVRIR